MSFGRYRKLKLSSVSNWYQDWLHKQNTKRRNDTFTLVEIFSVIGVTSATSFPLGLYIAKAARHINIKLCWRTSLLVMHSSSQDSYYRFLKDLGYILSTLFRFPCYLFTGNYGFVLPNFSSSFRSYSSFSLNDSLAKEKHQVNPIFISNWTSVGYNNKCWMKSSAITVGLPSSIKSPSLLPTERKNN